MTEETKRTIMSAALSGIIAAIIIIAGMFGLNVTVPAAHVTPAPSGAVGAQSVGGGLPNIDARYITTQYDVNVGRNLNVTGDSAVSGNSTTTGNSTITGNGAITGNLSVTGLITATAVSISGTYVGITPVATATPISGGYKFNGGAGIGTATPVLIVNSAGTSNLISARANDTPVFTVGVGGAINGASLSLAGTPVAWATPQPTATAQTLFMGAAASQYISCGSANVTGSATLTPVAGLTPVRVISSLQAVTGDAARVSGVTAGGVITISVYSSALTPVPNTTPAAVDYCIVGTH